jgi:hypothetical protein
MKVRTYPSECPNARGSEPARIAPLEINARRVRRKATIAMQSIASIALLNSETVFVAR